MLQFLAFICLFYIVEMLTVKDRLDQDKVTIIQAVSCPKTAGKLVEIEGFYRREDQLGRAFPIHPRRIDI